jgi:hypothetical protein
MTRVPKAEFTSHVPWYISSSSVRFSINDSKLGRDDSSMAGPVACVVTSRQVAQGDNWWWSERCRGYFQYPPCTDDNPEVQLLMKQYKYVGHRQKGVLRTRCYCGSKSVRARFALAITRQLPCIPPLPLDLHGHLYPVCHLIISATHRIHARPLPTLHNLKNARALTSRHIRSPSSSIILVLAPSPAVYAPIRRIEHRPAHRAFHCGHWRWC